MIKKQGWLLVRKHPEVIRKGRTVDLSDLLADPIVMFQRRFYIPLVLLIWAYLPAATAVYGWGESWSNALCGVVVFRYVISLHITWLVNSWAHSIGNRPYDRSIAPVEASIRHWLMGEGKILLIKILKSTFLSTEKLNFLSYHFFATRLPQLPPHLSLGLLGE